MKENDFQAWHLFYQTPHLFLKCLLSNFYVYELCGE